MLALWWLGAGLLVSGSVIIGRREDDASFQSSGDNHAGAREEKTTPAKAGLPCGTGASGTGARSGTSSTEATRRSHCLKSS